MTIEITNAQLEALILERMKSGLYASPEDVIREAMQVPTSPRKTGADLIAALQSSPHRDIEIMPERIPSGYARDPEL